MKHINIAFLFLLCSTLCTPHVLSSNDRATDELLAAASEGGAEGAAGALEDMIDGSSSDLERGFHTDDEEEDEGVSSGCQEMITCLCTCGIASVWLAITLAAAANS